MAGTYNLNGPINTTGNKLIFKDEDGSVNLSGYSDSDSANNTDKRRSGKGFVFTINRPAVTRCSSKQKTVSLSITETEYVCVG